MSSSKFDIVVYGATGFTGQLIAEYLAAHYKGDADLKWAMAGRSKDKLASVRDAIGAPADTPLIVADAADPASLNFAGRVKKKPIFAPIQRPSRALNETPKGVNFCPSVLKLKVQIAPAVTFTRR